MEEKTICPSCKKEFEIVPDFCDNCNYPFAGTDKEKGVFIGQRILKKGVRTDASKGIKRAKTALLILGFFHLLIGLAFVATANNYAYLVIGVIIVVFGFLIKVKPFVFILIPTIILGVLYSVDVFMFYTNPDTAIFYSLFSIVVRVALVGALIKILIDVKAMDNYDKRNK